MTRASISHVPVLLAVALLGSVGTMRAERLRTTQGVGAQPGG
jgi:hypothetical protein